MSALAGLISLPRPGPYPVSHKTPLRAGGGMVGLGEGRSDEGGHHAPAALAGMGERVLLEMHPTTLPCAVQDVVDKTRAVAALMPSCASLSTNRLSSLNPACAQPVNDHVRALQNGLVLSDNQLVRCRQQVGRWLQSEARRRPPGGWSQRRDRLPGKVMA